MSTLRGRWRRPRAGGALLAGDDPGVLASFGLSALGRLLARKGDRAASLAGGAWRTAARTNSVQPIALAGIARVEAAWLAGETAGAAELARVCWSALAAAPSATGRAAARPARCGHAVEVPAGCPPEFALGIAGDWAGAAERWRSPAPPTSTPWSAASGRQPELLEALAVLDRLGAVAAATLVRRDLRRMGSATSPAAPAPAPGPTRPASPTASSRS